MHLVVDSPFLHNCIWSHSIEFVRTINSIAANTEEKTCSCVGFNMHFFIRNYWSINDHSFWLTSILSRSFFLLARSLRNAHVKPLLSIFIGGIFFYYSFIIIKVYSDGRDAISSSTKCNYHSTILATFFTSQWLNEIDILALVTQRWPIDCYHRVHRYWGKKKRTTQAQIKYQTQMMGWNW